VFRRFQTLCHTIRIFLIFLLNAIISPIAAHWHCNAEGWERKKEGEEEAGANNGT
jgi:hypothetical protein